MKDIRATIWFTGLSVTGKTTISSDVAKHLQSRGLNCLYSLMEILNPE
jgi:adenylylsulfate kinase-like enzyme